MRLSNPFSLVSVGELLPVDCSFASPWTKNLPRSAADQSVSSSMSEVSISESGIAARASSRASCSSVSWFSGLFIFRSFSRGCLSSADYPYGLVLLAWVFPGMYHEKDGWSNCSYCPPSLFEWVGVWLGGIIRVVENLGCVFKADLVLSDISIVLLWVPGKEHRLPRIGYGP